MMSPPLPYALYLPLIHIYTCCRRMARFQKEEEWSMPETESLLPPKVLRCLESGNYPLDDFFSIVVPPPTSPLPCDVVILLLHRQRVDHLEKSLNQGQDQRPKPFFPRFASNPLVNHARRSHISFHPACLYIILSSSGKKIATFVKKRPPT